MTMTTGQHLFRFNTIRFQPLKGVLHLFQCTTIWNQSSDLPLRCLDVNLCFLMRNILRKLMLFLSKLQLHQQLWSASVLPLTFSSGIFLLLHYQRFSSPSSLTFSSGLFLLLHYQKFSSPSSLKYLARGYFVVALSKEKKLLEIQK